MSIRILIVDDHPAVLRGLECIFSAETDLVVVGTVQAPAQALSVYERTRPDVVVLDLSMPGLDGSSVMRQLREHDQGCRVLVLTSNNDPEVVHDVVRAGADGYLLKDCPAQSLVEGARSVARGESPIDPRVTRALLPRDAPSVAGVPTDPFEELTGRERDVLRLVSHGLANKQIASRLGIGESTVKTHLSSVFQRIGVTDRTSAALWARSHASTAGPRSAAG